MTFQLTPELRSQFETTGWIVVPDVFDGDECAVLESAALEVLLRHRKRSGRTHLLL